MPVTLSLSNHTLITSDDRVLCPDITLSFGPERTGLVGANGCGKSTLLSLLASDHPSLTRSGRVGMLTQSWSDTSQLVSGTLGCEAALARLARITAGHGSEDDFAEADWDLLPRVEAVLDQVGLSPDVLDRPLSDLSGGQRTRVGIGALLLDPPDMLLLDEPTNNLDASGRILIADLVRDWPGGVVVAGHDRDLLERMERIVELTPQGAQVIGGGWSTYREVRAARIARADQAVEDAQKELARTRRAIRDREEKRARRDRAGRKVRASGSQPKVLLDAKKDRAGQNAGREARLDDKMHEAAEAARLAAKDAVSPARDLRIALREAAQYGTVFNVTGITVQRGAFTLGPLDLTIAAGERLALTGDNGAGKSTLLAEVLAHAPTAALLDQQVSLLNDADSLYDNLRRVHPTMTPEQAHAALARFAFRNVAGERLAGSLSGGERLRAGLAMVLSGTAPDLIVLDEPTNHLDVEAIEVLETALAAYPGALLVVSHDRAFLDAIGIDRWLHLDAGQLTP